MLNPQVLLQLAQLSDSAVPIGSGSHSFGLETLVADGTVDVPGLSGFLDDYLEEVGHLEAGFCRSAWRLASTSDDFQPAWCRLNQELSAFRPVRESHDGSTALGRRFLRLVLSLEAHPRIQEALDAVPRGIHHVTAYGLAAGCLGADEVTTIATWLHHSVGALISAAQRLLPLGQSQAAALWWRLKPLLADIRDTDGCFTPLLDLASMRHPRLSTRLFIS